MLMSAGVQAPGERKTRRAITKLLKTEGPIDSAQLAQRLGLTAMAVRQHLYALQRELRRVYWPFGFQQFCNGATCLPLAGRLHSSTHQDYF